eukprot:CAMPEP_0173240120 /NCGR_PEP_ID=MMETSP1142-20121109/13588_1 /TAXON_ID=483371 /ORGANISM="non described non described, Strain CCMP2298" /LENGTH=127 /DNA_ID=CAMNT_0014171203 /DNA_START=727 /DNA_END=1111 /DNA_ORIENTATION=-
MGGIGGIRYAQHIHVEPSDAMVEQAQQCRGATVSGERGGGGDSGDLTEWNVVGAWVGYGNDALCDQTRLLSWEDRSRHSRRSASAPGESLSAESSPPAPSLSPPPTYASMYFSVSPEEECLATKLST